MPRKISSGTVLHRERGGVTEVLLVHPSGRVHATTPWGIPKGYPEEGETLEDAARRETWEETGLIPGALAPLGFVNYRRTSKRVHAFAGPAPLEEPRCASWEIDGARFMPLGEARARIHPDQLPLLDRLEALLAPPPASTL
ncbi:MAG: NUDIX domain-containing protein [Deltaproteobacteria bacterium]|nr:NUDIX domain-containing protein [Deltaproteobacteria bacterium]